MTEIDLVLKSDGRIDHLNLLPQELAPTVILVSDPDRVPLISKQFDYIEIYQQHREFVTHTGSIHGKRISAISTGIGTASLDIVLNELDALANIDFASGKVKPVFSPLQIVHLGTSHALQKDIALDSLILSQYAIGLDGLMNFYPYTSNPKERALRMAVKRQLEARDMLGGVYGIEASAHLLSLFAEHATLGITLSCPGFYAPQRRKLRLPLTLPAWFSQLHRFSYHGTRLLNCDMETAPLYGLASAFGHQVCSISVVTSHDVTQKRSRDPIMAIEKMINKTIDVLTELAKQEKLTQPSSNQIKFKK